MVRTIQTPRAVWEVIAARDVCVVALLAPSAAYEREARDTRKLSLTMSCTLSRIASKLRDDSRSVQAASGKTWAYTHAGTE